MAKNKAPSSGYIHEPIRKKSSTSGKPSMVKFSSMNKKKRASYKKYRGQGR